MKLCCDHKSAIEIANNFVQHDHTKNVEIDQHFIKEEIKDGIIVFPFVKSEQQLADMWQIAQFGALFQTFSQSRAISKLIPRGCYFFT